MDEHGRKWLKMAQNGFRSSSDPGFQVKNALQGVSMLSSAQEVAREVEDAVQAAQERCESEMEQKLKEYETRLQREMEAAISDERQAAQEAQR